MRKSLELTGRLNEPAQIYRQLRSFAKHFHHGRQEDAHELLRVAIEAMHQSCMKLIGRTKDGTCVCSPLSAAPHGSRKRTLPASAAPVTGHISPRALPVGTVTLDVRRARSGQRTRSKRPCVSCVP